MTIWRQGHNPSERRRGYPEAAPMLVRRPGCGAEIFIATGGVTSVVAGTPFATWGAWTALGTPVNDYYMSRLNITLSSTFLSTQLITIELGYGATPIQIDAFRFNATLSDASGDDTGSLGYSTNLLFPRVPGGQSLQARMTETTAKTWEVLTSGWDGYVPTFTPLPRNAPGGMGRYYPSSTSLTTIVVTPAIFPAWGIWVDVVNPAPNDMLVAGVHPLYGGFAALSTATVYQLGIGPAGNEMPVAAVISGRTLGALNINPPVWLRAGEALRIRAMSTSTSVRPTAVKVYDF